MTSPHDPIPLFPSSCHSSTTSNLSTTSALAGCFELLERISPTFPTTTLVAFARARRSDSLQAIIIFCVQPRRPRSFTCFSLGTFFAYHRHLARRHDMKPSSGSWTAVRSCFSHHIKRELGKGVGGVFLGCCGLFSCLVGVPLAHR